MRTKKHSDSSILDKAFDVISREGFESFTLKQVSEATGLSPAALIKRFESKKNLAILARNRRWDSNLSIEHKDRSYTDTGINGLFKLIEIITKSVDSSRLGEHARWLGTEALTPKSKKKVSIYFQTTRDILKKHIEEAQDKKEIGRKICSTQLSVNLEAFIQGVIFQYIFLYKQPHISQHLPHRVRYFLKPYLL